MNFFIKVTVRQYIFLLIQEMLRKWNYCFITEELIHPNHLICKMYKLLKLWPGASSVAAAVTLSV